jgi:sialate O-acetylesterase
MIAQWRALWSATPGTTDPHAPFGYVTIADGSDEAWGVSMGGLRWAQSANYGAVPNPALPNVFAADAHDLGDPWDANECNQAGKSCCVTKAQPLGPDCVGDHRGEWSFDETNWFQGQVHPRAKAPVGRRLAQAAFATAYGGPGPASGPVFAGCALGASSLRLTFDAARLAGAAVTWSPNASAALQNTALYVLVGAPFPAWAAANHHAADWRSYRGPYADGNEVGVAGWVAVDAVASGPAELTVDLSPLGGAVPTAVRYAYGTGGWGAPFQDRMCCGPTVDVSLQPCPMDSCPLHAAAPHVALPGVPFLAELVGGKCRCVAPQTCDE